MPIIAMLELELKPESVPAARDVMRRALQDTRAFDGSLGTDVLVVQDDEAHWIIYQRRGTVEHEEAYRSSRAGGRSTLTELPPLLACRDPDPHAVALGHGNAAIRAGGQRLRCSGTPPRSAETICTVRDAAPPQDFGESIELH